MGMPADPTRHWTFTHHDFKSADPRVKETVVECVACLWIEKGYTRRPDAKAAGRRHEDEANHE